LSLTVPDPEALKLFRFGLTGVMLAGTVPTQEKLPSGQTAPYCTRAVGFESSVSSGVS
jgi:hypothetical protein